MKNSARKNSIGCGVIAGWIVYVINCLLALETNDRQRILMQLISILGEDCKKVLMQYYFERQRMKVIAENMGLANEQVAKNKKSGCLKKLRSLVLDAPELQSILR